MGIATRRFFILVLFAVVFLAAGCGSDDDDDVGASADDDAAQDDDADDDQADDDIDDDISDDDIDDDISDDDAADDDSSGDDDTSPSSIWSDLAPQGLRVRQILGMATQMYDGPDENADRTFEISKLVESGLLRLRASIDWPDVEPQQDQFTFDYSDPFVNLIVDSGLQFDGRLCYGVNWAAPEDNDSAILPADFGDYAYHVAEHYCGKIDSHEIWNEENLDVFWQPEPDPDAYGSMLMAVFTAVHEACPGAKVVWGGLSPFQISTMLDQPFYFIEQVFQAHPDIADYFDVLAIHPYTFLQTPPPEWTFYLGDYEFYPNMPGQIRLARQRLANIGAAGKPIWLTEWGWPSLIIGQQAQADFFVRGALLSIAEGVEALDWYTFYDREPGSGTIPTENYFGLFTWPGAEEGPQAKPVFYAASALSQTLGALRFAGDLSEKLDLPEGVFGYAFLDEETGDFTFAGWTGQSQLEYSLDLPVPPGAAQYEAVGEFGDMIGQGSAGDAISLQLTNEVTYVRFD